MSLFILEYLLPCKKQHIFIVRLRHKRWINLTNVMTSVNVTLAAKRPHGFIYMIIYFCLKTWKQHFVDLTVSCIVLFTEMCVCSYLCVVVRTWLWQLITEAGHWTPWGRFDRKCLRGVCMCVYGGGGSGWSVSP